MYGEDVADPAVVLAAHGVGLLVAQLRAHARGAGEVGEKDRRGRAAAAGRVNLGCGGEGLVQCGVLGENCPLQRLELRPWAQPQLGVEGPRRLLVRVERVGLAAGAVEGEHELRARALAQRVAGHERLEFGHQLAVPAELEVRLDPVLQCRRAHALQPRDLRLGEGLEGEVGQRRAAPLRERRAQTRGGTLRDPGRERAPTLVGHALEALEVELARLQEQAVAGRRAHEPPTLGRKRPPQPRDGHLERLHGALRRPLAPQILD